MLKVLHQRGLSMIELLVALAISSFLILGITQVYIDNKRNYVFQQSQAGNLENSRFAVLMIDELLSKAGYRRAPDQEMLDAFPSSNELSTDCEGFPAEAALTKIKATGGQTGFCMRYQPAMADELTCDGIAAPLSKKVFGYPSQAETIYVAVKFTPHASDLNKGTLSCVSNKGSALVELIDGIADMKVEFGAGQNNEKKLAASNPFKDAQSWTATDGPVRAVRYSVLAASRNNQRDGDS
ncbi:MAG: prepilin-type N-terminal cleavage/methylation domain-containing protein, partial [Pseudomonas sp.]